MSETPDHAVAGAQPLGDNAIHPTAVIGANVRMGTGNVIGPHVVLAGNTVLGDGNWLGPGVVVGSPPEIRGTPHTADWIDSDDGYGVQIGSHGVLREGTQVHAGSGRATTVGDHVFIMNSVYIGHDGQVADYVTMASNVACGGHVHLGYGANLGLGTVVHQRRHIGALAMVGMGSVVVKDIPVFCKAFGNPCRVHGVNSVGMERNGVSRDSIAQVERSIAEGRDVTSIDAEDVRRFVDPSATG